MTKWITITVPVTEGPGLTLNGVGWFDDGARGVAVHHEGRELRLMADDIGAAVLVALRAPAGQRAEIQARHDAAGDGRSMDLGDGWQAHEDRGELLDMVKRLSEPTDATAWRSGPEWPEDRSAKLAAIEAHVGTFRSRDDADAAFCVALEWATAEIREADAVLVALGISEDGRSLAERIAASRVTLPDPTGVWARLDVLAGKVVAIGEKMEADRAAKRGATAPEPPPLVTGSEPIWPLVIADAEALGCAALVADMKARDAFGRGKYGTPLTADNGRNHLADAYQEGLDEVVYLRAAVQQGRSVDALYHEALAHAVKLRGALDVDALRERIATLGDQIDGYEHAGTQPPPALVAEYHEVRARLAATEKATRGTPRIVVTPVEAIERGESLAFVDGPGFHGVAPMPTARYPKSPRGEGMRDLRRLTGATLGDVARALNLSTPEVSGLERGSHTTDDAGWTEIQTVCFLLGSNVKVEHILDPASSPSFQRAMAGEWDDLDDVNLGDVDAADAVVRTRGGPQVGRRRVRRAVRPEPLQCARGGLRSGLLSGAHEAAPAGARASSSRQKSTTPAASWTWNIGSVGNVDPGAS